jgi:hypothetical protein
MDTPLNSSWILWIHSPKNKEWNIKSFKKIIKISNLNDLISISKNFNNLGVKYNHLFFMRDGINPIWEDENNRSGGTCSFRTDMSNYNKDNTYVLDFAKFLFLKIVGETLIEENNDINGFSISPKNNWAIVKIWNKNQKNDIAKLISEEFNNKFKNLSIRYKPNTPEY